MRHSRRVTAAVALAIGVVTAAVLAGCTFGKPKDKAASPTGHPSASASASVSARPTAQAPVLGVDGAGVYKIGAKLTTLRSSGAVAHLESSTGCGDWTVGKGVGEYTDLSVVFHNGALLWVEVSNPTIVTAEGVKTGMTQAAAKAAYPDAATLSDGLGGTALAVHRAKGMEFLIRIGKASGLVASIEAGPAADLEPRFTQGEGC
jgi:hypothetical protein